jgi:hypothetical protein
VVVVAPHPAVVAPQAPPPLHPAAAPHPAVVTHHQAVAGLLVALEVLLALAGLEVPPAELALQQLAVQGAQEELPRLH